VARLAQVAAGRFHAGDRVGSGSAGGDRVKIDRLVSIIMLLLDKKRAGAGGAV